MTTTLQIPPAKGATLTAEEFLAWPDSKGFELDDGRLLERNVGAISSWVSGRIHFLIQRYLEDQPIGKVWPEGTSYRCFPSHPNRIRKPDVSVILNGRLPGGKVPATAAISLAPDMAVEVISPSDLAWEVDRKIQQFIQAGVRLIWIVNPDTRTVRVHHTNDQGRIHNETDQVSGDDILPGFVCKVGDMFLPLDEVEIIPESDTED